jgi:DNA-binding LacI/PurR family transcriptional regulator
MSLTLDQDRTLAKRPRVQEACIRLYEIAQQLGEGEKLPTMSQLRSQLGISVQTLNDAVRELEKRSVLYSVHGVGIYVAQRRQRQLTGNVGFVAPYKMQSEEYTYWSLVLAGMREPVRKYGGHLLLIDDDENFDRWDKIDGVVLYEGHNPDDPHPATPHPPAGFPCISIISEITGYACVSIDDFASFYQITQHLISQGHRRIAYLASENTGITILEDRKKGYLKALSDHGITPQADWFCDMRNLRMWDDKPHWYDLAGAHYVEQWLKKGWKEQGFTALVTQNDSVALGAIAAFEQAGYRVPRDVSVTGYDGVVPQKSGIQLTTVRIPLFDVGRIAMESLLQWLEYPNNIPQTQKLVGEFVAGQSAATAP